MVRTLGLLNKLGKQVEPWLLSQRYQDYRWGLVLRTYGLLGMLGLTNRFANFTMTVDSRYGEIEFRPFFLNEVLMISGAYEPFVREVFRPKNGEVVVDVGSYIGMYTMFASRSVGPLGKVISIEPNPDNFSILMSNIRRNSLSNVAAVPSAVGAENSEAKLIVPSQYPAGSLIETDHLPSDEKHHVTRSVHVKSIDYLMRELSITKVDWIKIDAEGMQTEVLQGCRETITNCRPKIIIEGGNDAGEYLEELGYTVERLRGTAGFVGYIYAYSRLKGGAQFPLA